MFFIPFDFLLDMTQWTDFTTHEWGDSQFEKQDAEMLSD